MDSSGWDDFTNNLATDLAPLITLFGDQVTKQYLSESVGFLDTLIFALAPLGIITAVVSAIRVSGSPSLRAFVGRAQEGPGNAEVELLSCTSETTAELWNGGGIARVFGNPMVLEVVVEEDDSITGEPVINFVCDAKASWEEHASEKVKHENHHNSHKSTESPASTSNVRSSGGNNRISGIPDVGDPDLRLRFIKSSPNLSLNKGIKKRAHFWFHGAGVLGFALVIGEFVSLHLR